MEVNIPSAEELRQLKIQNLGEAKFASPLGLQDHLYLGDQDKIMVYTESAHLDPFFQRTQIPPMFESAGPRKNIFFDPSQLTCGIVTCGGLCPGLNDVIRTITLTLLWKYGVKNVLGFRYGYEGISSNARSELMELSPSMVGGIQHQGGTILGSSRGHQEPEDMVNTLLKHKIGILFVIGGDGTFRGAHEIVKEIQKRNLKIAVIGIPKTIDNDIYCAETSFGFSTSVEEARKSIASAHEEARSAFNGIGLVKLMGRDSGFIATCSSLANSDVNFCLIPEIPFQLHGEGGLLNRVENRLNKRRHVMIVVAEGAGQNLIQETENLGKDSSGNVRYGDIGRFLKKEIQDYFKEKNIPVSLKYIDPSYTIRSCPANARDSIFCLLLGQMATHAGMAGKTDMFIGFWSSHFTHVPLPMVIDKKQKINPDGVLWQTLLAMTE